MPTYGDTSYGGGPYAGTPAGNSPGSQLNGGQFPALIVEAGFGFGALDEPITWTDITTWVRSYTINRGRQHELNKFEAGTATVTLNNRDGRFSSFNGSSPYSPNILPLVPLRIRAVWNGVTWPRFRGNVESWSLKWPTANDSDIVISAVDATKALNLKKVSTMSQYPATILADAPYLWWRLGDAAGSSVAADSSGNGRTGTVATSDPAATNPYFFGGAGGIVADSDTAFDCGLRAGIIRSGVISVNQNSVSMECWVKMRSLDPDVFGAGVASVPMGLNNTGLGVNPQLNLGINNSFTFAPSGSPYATVDSGGGTIVNVVGQLKVITIPVNLWDTRRVADSVYNVTLSDPMATNDGQWHHYVITSDGATLKLYVDGLLHGSAAAAVSGVMNRLSVGAVDGVVDDVAIYTTALSATQVAAHYQAGAYPRNLELAGTRINAYLDAIGWSASLRNIDAGNSQLQAANNGVTGSSVLSNMQDAADTENGQLFIDAAGKMTFFDRFHTSRSPNATVAVVLGDSGTVGEEPYLLAGTDPVLDDTDIWNDIAITPTNMGPQIAGDATSQARYGKRTRSVSTQNASAVEAANRAYADLNRYKAPTQRIKQVSFTPMSDPAVLFPAALGFDLLTRVEVRRRPMDGSGSTFDQTALIEGITEAVDAAQGTWLTTWRQSPTDASPVFWIIEDPVAGKIVDGALQSPPVAIGY
jgi:hypothetical protein